MFNLWNDSVEPEKREYPWVQNWKESRRNYIRTDKYRICIDYIEAIHMGSKAGTDITVILIYMEGRKDPLRIDREDATQFMEAWDAIT